MRIICGNARGNRGGEMGNKEDFFRDVDIGEREWGTVQKSRFFGLTMEKYLSGKGARNLNIILKKILIKVSRTQKS